MARELLLSTLFSASNNAKIMKRSIRKKFKEDRASKLVICPEITIFRILGFQCIHAYAVNVSYAILDFTLKMFILVRNYSVKVP